MNKNYASGFRPLERPRTRQIGSDFIVIGANGCDGKPNGPLATQADNGTGNVLRIKALDVQHALELTTGQIADKIEMQSTGCWFCQGDNLAVFVVAARPI
jgi:hypothetical protein